MGKKLNTYVHVVERDEAGNELHAATFGPDDTVPEWAVNAITNPDVWDDGQEPEASAESESGTPTGDGPPPRAGKGSSREAWAAYATAHGVEFDEDASREDIIAACELAEIPTE